MTKVVGSNPTWSLLLWVLKQEEVIVLVATEFPGSNPGRTLHGIVAQ